MKSKSLRDLNTTTTKHIHARPPQRGVAYLEMYLLGIEKQRLQQEMTNLDQRQGRIKKRLMEIREELAQLRQVAQQEADKMSDGVGAEAMANPARPSPGQAQPRWKTISLEY